ncbi:MAG: hypothetical protein KAH01_02235 [Caldisericia bacterium]|nr:hypothetical protein [Caldisericia bacterium]
MKEKGLIITDWRHGYNTPESLNDPRYRVAFATPHSMIFEPRQGELLNLKISILSEKVEFNSEEEVNMLMEKIRENPDYLDLELQKLKLTQKEKNYFTYRELLSKANENNGISAMKYILKSLLYTEEPIDSLIWIAKNVAKDVDEKYQIYWKASTASDFLSNRYSKKKELESTCWTDHWFRPYMRGIASFFAFQLEIILDEDEDQQAINSLHDIMELDSSDPMGIRFILMSQYSRLENYKQMETLYKKFPDDSQNPLFLYPMAFMTYKTKGDTHPDTASFIKKALESNIFIAFRSFQNNDNTPFEGSHYLPRSEEEAHYFFTINFDILCMEEDQQVWLYKSFHQHIEDFKNQHLGAQA